MKYIYMYNGCIVLETNDIQTLDKVVEAARNVLEDYQIEETKIKCYQKIY